MQYMTLDCSCGNSFNHPLGKRGRRPSHCPTCRVTVSTEPKCDPTCSQCSKQFPREHKKGRQFKLCPDCRTEEVKPENECERCHSRFKRNRGPHQALLCPTCREADKQAKKNAKRIGKKRMSTGADFETTLTGEALAEHLDRQLRLRGTHLSLHREESWH